ncbi:MAG: ankyrin repeat domain-containing protein [Gammaproteobacteria bacterium]|nr:ankyrin repeat domain-containing protein [Gammaproteobacteria bacterium]
MDVTLKSVLAKIQEVTEFLGTELTDVNQRGIFGNTPLKVATVWGDPQAVRVLIEAGADVNAKVEDGYTPLHHAIAQGHSAVARLLIDNGARADMSNNDGQTPLDFAYKYGQREIAELLQAQTRLQ